MDGLLLIDKPAGPTSHQVIEVIRRKLKIKKVGHAGTLDPLATGLLVVMVGKATKLSNLLISQFKTYEVAMKLFLETDTGDITGQVIKKEPALSFTWPQIQAVLNSFGNDYVYWQIPPLYSAVKVQGRKLYEYARKGLKVEVAPRKVTIKSISLVDYSEREGIIKLFVECSKGTYIRSLVGDIAKKLGTIATVFQLRRTSSGKFRLDQALKLEEVSEDKIISVNDLEFAEG